MSVVIKSVRWTPLHVRAKQLLAEHDNKLEAADRDYVTDLLNRKIVWGTEFQVKRIKDIEVKLAVT